MPSPVYLLPKPDDGADIPQKFECKIGVAFFGTGGVPTSVFCYRLEHPIPYTNLVFGGTPIASDCFGSIADNRRHSSLRWDIDYSAPANIPAVQENSGSIVVARFKMILAECIEEFGDLVEEPAEGNTLVGWCGYAPL